ncbi:hypothetical protein LU673_25330 [Pseudomonas alloputida]|uniref:hypothetical protein n=1 Tax=Pseudomonas alloputida TaxID=1940621 RepID=UPI001E354742|nr:hypothetical protein [Pseudomonas alloputida]MCE0923299.1 hypothetical protein [Pseudomonas alloputida]
MKLPARPLSNAERQEKLRKHRREHGIKPVYVGPTERELLARALAFLVHAGMSDGEAASDAVALLEKVAPGMSLADLVQEVAEKQRAYVDECRAHQQTRAELAAAVEEVRSLRMAVLDIASELGVTGNA